jgi:hypothetical protein
MKNGKPINEISDNIKITKDGKRIILFIKSFDESQAGVYSLVLNNSNGRDEASFNLAVLPVQSSSTSFSVNFFHYIC